MVVEPQIIQCKGGEWLAISPAGVPFRFGVTAPTETEVREKFRRSLDKWASQTVARTIETSPFCAEGDGEPAA